LTENAQCIHYVYMNTVLNFRTKKTLKDDAQKVARELGVSLGTVMNLYLEEFVREKKLLLTSHPTPSSAVVTELAHMSAEARAGKHISPKFSDPEDAIAWLNIPS